MSYAVFFGCSSLKQIVIPCGVTILDATRIQRYLAELYTGPGVGEDFVLD